MKKKLVVVSSRFPYPLEKGDKLRLYYQIRELSKYFEVHLFSVNHGKISDEDISELKKITENVICLRLNRFRVFLSLLLSVVYKEPLQVALFYDNSARSFLNKYINQLQPDHLYCQLIRSAKYITEIPLPKTIDLMDAFSYGMKKRSHFSRGLMKFLYKREASLIRNYESRIVNEFDNKTIISEQDLDRLSYVKELQVVNNGVDVAYYTSVNKNGKYDFGFVGNLGYFPNVKAVEFISKEIYPQIEKYKKYRFGIFGARASKSLIKLNTERFEIVGWVDDIRDAYESIKVLLVPIFGGMGQQNKVLEAMSMGIPCVVSEEVALALGVKDGVEVLIAKTKVDFVNNALELLNNQELYIQLSKNGRSFVTKNYSWSKVTRKLVSIVGN